MEQLFGQISDRLGAVTGHSAEGAIESGKVTVAAIVGTGVALKLPSQSESEEESAIVPQCPLLKRSFEDYRESLSS